MYLSMQKETSRKALVIDDDRIFAEAVRKLLELSGFDVLVAQGGEEGVDMAGREFPDIILCDVQMKAMHGYATTRAIRQNPSLVDTPIILVTGTATKLGETRGKNAGADYYLSKPIRSSELTALLQLSLGPYKPHETPDSRTRSAA
jgi:CheY-like chemotaxis protein